MTGVAQHAQRPYLCMPKNAHDWLVSLLIDIVYNFFLTEKRASFVLMGSWSRMATLGFKFSISGKMLQFLSILLMKPG